MDEMQPAIGQPRRKDRHTGTALLVRMPTELHKQIQAFCAAEDRNMAQVVRLALREFFERQEAESHA